MAVLKVTNIPAYIVETEFKRVWTQPGLDCQSCNFAKGPNSETVGYLRFASPQAAGRVQQMYNGWQGYGNPEGIRIDFAADDGSSRAKREREDSGAEDQTFKQGRLMPATATGFHGFGGFGGSSGGQSLGQLRPGDGPYDPMQPGLGADPNQGQAQQGGSFGNVQTSQSASSFGQPTEARRALKDSAVDSPAGKGFQGGHAPTANGVATSQGFGMLGQRDNGQQRSQPQFGQGAGMQPQQNSGFGQGQAPAFPQQSFPGTQAYDPRTQQPPGGASLQQQQQQPQGSGPGMIPAGQQLLPQQVASLAEVLAPLLQQSQAGAAQTIVANPGLLASQGLVTQMQANNPPQAAQIGGLVDQIQQQFAHGQPQQFQMPQHLQQQQLAPQQQQLGPPQQLQQPPLLMQQPPVQHPPGVVMKQDNFQPPAEALPSDAAQTLYVDGMPLDVSKREMAHIFRPFEGFREIRMVEKKDKHGNPLVLSFAEFETPLHANAALKILQGYPMDASLPNEANLRICFAKPFKPNDPRSRTGGAGQPTARIQPFGIGQGQPAPHRQWNEPPSRAGDDQRTGHRQESRPDRRDRSGGARPRFSDRPDRRPDDRRPPSDRRR